MLRHRAGELRTDFKHSLGKVSYHVPCHLRVQNMGLKTRDVLRLVPDTTVEAIVAANEMTDPDVLAVGDELIIPADE